MISPEDYGNLEDKTRGGRWQGRAGQVKTAHEGVHSVTTPVLFSDPKPTTTGARIESHADHHGAFRTTYRLPIGCGWGIMDPEGRLDRTVGCWYNHDRLQTGCSYFGVLYSTVEVLLFVDFI